MIKIISCSWEIVSLGFGYTFCVCISFGIFMWGKKVNWHIFAKEIRNNTITFSINHLPLTFFFDSSAVADRKRASQSCSKSFKIIFTSVFFTIG